MFPAQVPTDTSQEQQELWVPCGAALGFLMLERVLPALLVTPWSFYPFHRETGTGDHGWGHGELGW